MQLFHGATVTRSLYEEISQLSFNWLEYFTAIVPKDLKTHSQKRVIWDISSFCYLNHWALGSLCRPANYNSFWSIVQIQDRVKYGCFASSVQSRWSERANVKLNTLYIHESQKRRKKRLLPIFVFIKRLRKGGRLSLRRIHIIQSPEIYDIL